MSNSDNCNEQSEQFGPESHIAEPVFQGGDKKIKGTHYRCPDTAHSKHGLAQRFNHV